MTKVLKITDIRFRRDLRDLYSILSIYKFTVGGLGRLGIKRNNWYLENYDGPAAIQIWDQRCGLSG